MLNGVQTSNFKNETFFYLSSKRSRGYLTLICFALVGLATLFAGCSRAPAPASTPVSAASPTATPMPPPEAIPGRWTTYIGENQSQERNGVIRTVKQLRFGTTDRLFPDASESELTEVGLNRARGVVGVLIEIENTTSEPIEVFPGGIFASIVLNSGEELSPAAPISDVRGTINAGQTRNFLVVFPIIQTRLIDVQEITYNLNGLEFTYTDLKNIGGPEG